MSKIRQSDIIAITVSVIVALFIAGLMIRSTRKTLREHARHTAEREHKNNHDNMFFSGGSKSKSLGQHPYLTTTNAFLLFAGVFIGYILSHFR
jgi:multidrug efflux pump subunit AcrB